VPCGLPQFHRVSARHRHFHSDCDLFSSGTQLENASRPSRRFLVVVNAGWVATVLAIFGTRYRDIQPVVSAVVQLMLFVTPIMCTASSLGNATIVAEINPARSGASCGRNGYRSADPHGCHCRCRQPFRRETDGYAIADARPIAHDNDVAKLWLRLADTFAIMRCLASSAPSSGARP
jgi:hypothetical protein